MAACTAPIPHLPGLGANYYIIAKPNVLDRVGSLGAGGVTNQNASGWRNIFWMQAAFHLATSLGLILFYHPPRRSDYPKLKLRKFVWSMDPIGSLLFISSTTLMLLALDWAAGTYPWHDVHVAVPLGTGCGLLLAFAIYGLSPSTKPGLIFSNAC